MSINKNNKNSDNSDFDIRKGLDNEMFYQISGNRVTCMGQLYINPNDEESSLNVNNTSMMLMNEKYMGDKIDKLYALYGTGVINTETWNHWSNKMFNNSGVKYIRVGSWFSANIKIENAWLNNGIQDINKFNSFKLKFPFVGIVEVDIEKGIYILTISGQHEIELPDCIITEISLTQIKDKEYFEPFFPKKENFVHPEFISESIREIIIVILIFSGLIFLIGYLWYKRDDYGNKNITFDTDL